MFKEKKVTIDLSEKNELCSIWLEQLVMDAIDEEDGTMSNERLFAKGSETKEQEQMHMENVTSHEEYRELLEGILCQLRALQ